MIAGLSMAVVELQGEVHELKVEVSWLKQWADRAEQE